MGRGVLQLFALIMPASDDAALVHDHGADRDVIVLKRDTGFADRMEYHTFVDCELFFRRHHVTSVPAAQADTFAPGGFVIGDACPLLGEIAAADGGGSQRPRLAAP